MYFTDGDGVEPYLFAENTLDFLRLISISYEEITATNLYGEEPNEPELPELLAPLRRWVEETFDVQVPTAWADVVKRPL